MPFRFWRRIRIAPGVTLNLSKGGASVSVGRRGAHLTAGRRGRRATVGIPGTGLFWSRRLDGGGREPARRRKRAPGLPATPDVNDRLDLGFFRRLVTPPQEKAFIDGCREVVRGDERAALRHLRQARHLADGVFLAGLVALSLDDADEAAACLADAVRDHRRLGATFRKYGLALEPRLPITDEITATIAPDLRGALLALVEAHQRRQDHAAAAAALERLRRLEPDDVVVRLSLAELLWAGAVGDRATLRRVAALGEGIANDSAVHAALLLYRGRALRALGLRDAALAVLTAALRRRKDRPADLLHALRYERALLLEEMGHRRRARAELERLYAEAPDYADVARRLGM